MKTLLLSASLKQVHYISLWLVENCETACCQAVLLWDNMQAICYINNFEVTILCMT